MLTVDQAAGSVAQYVNTVFTSVRIPGQNGEDIVAVDSEDIVCHAFSADGTRFIAATSHGFIRFGRIVPKEELRDVQLHLEFPSETTLESFARANARLHADDYHGSSVNSVMTHYRGYRQWKRLAVIDGPHLVFAAMDDKGAVEIWKLDGCIWRRERVRQWRKSSVYDDGDASLEWDPSGSFLRMKDTYGRPYRFLRQGWLRKRWQQVQVRDAG